ncbi:hypothetical protein ACFWEH_30110 [Streptomyces anulatus]|uniref:hypothetical protein n=1 Tax=Streptomyces TaxID=1883 RepID=UPI0011613A3D|nr:hypothetical protein [Streptomyces sp. TSRI0395]
MDAGLAAVCGALAGAVGTAAAAFTTGLAQREAARITARMEHRKDRRQPRYDAYREFIDAVSSLIDVPRTAVLPVDQRVAEIGTRIKEAWLTVSVLGPDSAQRSASGVRAEALKFETTILACQGSDRIHFDNFWMNRERPESERMQATIMQAELGFGGSELDEHLQEFISAVQSVLDDDGSRRKVK